MRNFLLIAYFVLHSSSLFAKNLIASDMEKESIYVFTYLSPGSHAMVNSANAWDFMVKRKGIHSDSKLYRLPYIESVGHSTEYAAKAYFMLRQLVANKAVDHFSLEPKIYTLFKTEVVNDERLNDFFVNNVDGLSLPEAERLNRSSLVYVKHALEIQKSFRCKKLPCSRVSVSDKVYVVTLNLEAEDPLTEFWEHVSLILL
jgi:hypothetical protein